MTDWIAFLAEHGARIDRATVVSFGDSPAELEAARDHAVVCDLAPLGVLRVAGPDAAAFLQGQLTNDVVSLRADTSQLAAWCSPKGRMLANFLVRRLDETAFELIFSRSLLESVRKRLQMFVLRAKVTIEDASAASIRLGVGGLAAATVLGDTQGAVPALHQWSTSTAGVAVTALPGGRYMAVALPQHAQAWWRGLAGVARPAGFPAWEWLTIRAGVPMITATTSDQFVPQAANFDALGGVNFQKGCYTGQEIVARTQYLGRLKERLTLAHVDGASPAPGDRLYSTVFGDQACGSIVNVAAAPGGGHDLLAVLQNAARDSGDVRLAVPDGRKLALLPLPYPMPEAAPPRAR
ncbi:MAG: folate-binding protein, partial [Casimicrobiaceae bacterium]